MLLLFLSVCLSLARSLSLSPSRSLVVPVVYLFHRSFINDAFDSGRPRRDGRNDERKTSRRAGCQSRAGTRGPARPNVFCRAVLYTRWESLSLSMSRRLPRLSLSPLRLAACFSIPRSTLFRNRRIVRQMTRKNSRNDATDNARFQRETLVEQTLKTNDSIAVTKTSLKKS